VSQYTVVQNAIPPDTAVQDPVPQGSTLGGSTLLATLPSCYQMESLETDLFGGYNATEDWRDWSYYTPGLPMPTSPVEQLEGSSDVTDHTGSRLLSSFSPLLNIDDEIIRLLNEPLNWPEEM
jgi:hypothetical protein